MNDPKHDTPGDAEIEAVLPPRMKGFETGSSPESGIQSNSPELNISENSDSDQKLESEQNFDQSESSKSDANENPDENVENSDGENLETNLHELQNVPRTSGSLKGLLKNRESPKNNRHIRFACVREYLFARKQSFCTLPSTGGCALGMNPTHYNQETIPLLVHREQLHSKRRKKLRHWRQKQRRLSAGLSAGQDVSEDVSSSSDSDSDAPEEDLTGVDDWWFLQPIAPKQRRKILKKTNNEVDSQDRQNNRVLRSNREVCGCSCVGVCHPASCECATNGISCQVDRDGFPCGCQVGRCGNPSGRRSFNSARVRHHFFKTMYRLRCQEQGTNQNTEQAVMQTPPVQPEVPLDEPQQPYSFGDFTRPSDFQGTIYWPQQWDSNQVSQPWNGISAQGVAEDASPSRLCENVPACDDHTVLQAATAGSLSSESSTEDSSVVSEVTGGQLGSPESQESEPIGHESNITVVNEDSRDSQSSSVSVE